MNALREFIYMGGYWPYVWSAYGLSVVVLAVNAWLCLRREKRFFEEPSPRTRGRTGS